MRYKHRMIGLVTSRKRDNSNIHVFTINSESKLKFIILDF